jgi:hypothetical protein
VHRLALALARLIRTGEANVVETWSADSLPKAAKPLRVLSSRPRPVVFPRGPDPFSLADPTTVERILSAGGFAKTTCTDVREPVYYGENIAVLGLGQRILEHPGHAASTRCAFRRARAGETARDSCRAQQGTGRVVRLARGSSPPPVDLAAGDMHLAGSIIGLFSPGHPGERMRLLAFWWHRHL